MANSTRKQPVQSSPRIAGYFRGIPIEVRDDMPEGTIYFLKGDSLRREATITNLETRKWRTKIHDTLRAFFRRFQANQREN